MQPNRPSNLLSRVLNYYFKDEGVFKDNLPRYIAEAFSNVYIVSNNNSLDLFKQVLKLLDLKNEDVSDWIENSLYNNTSGSFYSKIFWKDGENLLMVAITGILMKTFLKKRKEKFR